MGQWQHKISNVNVETKTADCTHCGNSVRVKLKRGKNNYTRWACKKSERRWNKHKYKYTYRPRPCSETHCKICGDQVKLVWDHDHTTGKFRGWLCRLCNSGLGMFRDSPERLQAAIKYLEMTKASKG